MNFDLYNHLLKIRESIKIPTPKVGVHLGVWGFIPSHSLALSRAWNVTFEFTLAPHFCKPLPWSQAQGYDYDILINPLCEFNLREEKVIDKMVLMMNGCSFKWENMDFMSFNSKDIILMSLLTSLSKVHSFVWHHWLDYLHHLILEHSCIQRKVKPKEWALHK
jgi:hypothetical protein